MSARERGAEHGFPRGKYGLKVDPRGAQIAFDYQGRTLLGDVTGVRYDEVTGCIRLTVRHFNGEPWPIEPPASSVMVLERNSP